MEVTDPQVAGMDAKRLERITPIMEGFVKDNQLPGIMTLVQRHGAVVHFGKYGLMDIEAGKPMQEDALFRIYSMTKPIICVALMMLFEEGRFSLKDPVSKFIPAFKNTKVFVEAGVLGPKLVEQEPEMTLYHLLTHTCGLSYGWFFDSPVEDVYRRLAPFVFQRDGTLADTIEQIAKLPLLFQPGSKWHYSVANDDLCYVIQNDADKPLADFLQERIFKPLGMVDTAFSVPPEKVSRLAQIYTSAELYKPVPIKPEMVGMIADVTTPTSCPSGGAGLISTLADYLAFCNCLLNQGKYDGGILISRKTLAWMTANHIPPSMMPISDGVNVMDHGFGLGFRVTTSLGEKRELSSVGEYGWGGAAQTYFWIDPAEDFIGLIMTQHMPLAPYPVQERFRNLAYQAIVD
jgi:CubicO group peptidase (beta-lactamase class C family)